MAVFAMIHGGAHGAWCWERVLPYLDRPMIALDLPGRGRRPAELERQTYDSFLASARADILSADLQDIVLVAHSMGGLTAIRLMDDMPERIRHVVFVATPIPCQGVSIGAMMQRSLQMTHEREESHTALETGASNLAIEQMLFHDLTETDRAFCLARISAESMAVYNEAVTLDGLSQPIPRTYVRTLRDRGLPPALQVESITRIPDARVEVLDTGHTAMFADPIQLASILNRIALG